MPADPFGAVAGWPCEEQVVPLARESWLRAWQEPWGAPLRAALRAHAQIRDALGPLLNDYASDLPDDPLPSLWGR